MFSNILAIFKKKNEMAMAGAATFNFSLATTEPKLENKPTFPIIMHMPMQYLDPMAEVDLTKVSNYPTRRWVEENGVLVSYWS